MGRKGITVGRRNNGEGSIQKRKDGRWCGRYSVDGKRKYVYGKTRKEVSEKLFKLISESKSSYAFDIDSKILIRDHMNDWLENSVRASVSIRTYERRGEVTRLHVIPLLGDMKLKDLTPNHLRRLYREKLDSGLSPRSVNHIHCTLNKALNEAVRWRIIPVNVCGLVNPPRCPDEEMKVLTSKQVGRLLEISKGDRFEALYYLAVTTGMRRGELLALKWEDVNFNRGTVQVKRSLSRIRGGLIFVSPKSAKGRRNIALTTGVIEALRKHRVIQDEERSRENWQENGLVFPTTVGTPLYPHLVVQRSFKKLLRKAGLPLDTRFHDLRHTAATLLLTKGVHPKIVQELLGHSSISITLDTYSHVLPNMQSEAVRAMEDIFKDD